jgi:hypothetical protein
MPWYYKRILGNGTFGSIGRVAPKLSPAALSAGLQQMLDLAGEGHLEHKRPKPASRGPPSPLSNIARLASISDLRDCLKSHHPLRCEQRLLHQTDIFELFEGGWR